MGDEDRVLRCYAATAVFILRDRSSLPRQECARCAIRRETDKRFSRGRGTRQRKLGRYMEGGELYKYIRHLGGHFERVDASVEQPPGPSCFSFPPH
jgi:hypothetical protein